MAIGLHFNNSDLNVWRERALQNQSIDPQNQGWPNIVSKAATFLASPLDEIWTGVSRPITEYVRPGDTPYPEDEGKFCLMGAFYALVENDSTYASAVKQFLQAQMQEPKTDFSNTTHWDVNYANENGPFWVLGEWLTRLLYSYDYIKDFLTTQERSDMDTWFHDAGVFIHQDLNNRQNTYFANETDRANGDILEDWGGFALASDPYLYDGLRVYTHRDETNVKYNALNKGNTLWNNRAMALSMYVGLAGVFFNEPEWIKNAKYTFKNQIRLQLFYDCTNAEAYRTTDDENIEAGYFYTAAIYSDLSHVADALYRIGDSELYSFVTSKGFMNSQGGNKSLRLGWEGMNRYKEETLISGGTAYAERTTTNDEINKINGDSVTTWHGVHNCWCAWSNMYYKDSYLEAGYKMEYLGGYPSSPMAGNVSYMMQGGVMPDVIFMWGDRKYGSNMKEERFTSRANAIRPAYTLLPQMVFYPTGYASLAAAVADIKNLRVGVFFHGSGERGTNLDLLYNHPLPELLSTSLNRDGEIWIAPQLPLATLWVGSYLDRIIDMLDTEYANARNYYVTGLSLGGMAVYNIIERYPTKFSAGGVLSGNMSQIVSAIPNTSRTEIRAWHGTNDSVVTYASGAAAIATLESQGYPREHTLVDITGGVHDIWGEVYDTDNLFFPWLDEKIANESIADGDGRVALTNERKAICQDRAINGPYKTEGDKFPYSPGSWDNIVTLADKYMNNEVTDFWDGDFISDTPTAAAHGEYIMACAFYYIIKGDEAYGQKAKAGILAQIANSNPVFEDYMGLDDAWGNSFHFATFTNRLFMAFDYTKDLWNSQEIESLNTYMERAIAYYWDAGSYYMYDDFPNRDSGDYATRGGWAASGEGISASYPEANNYTHYEEVGGYKNHMRAVNIGKAGYGNGEAAFILGIGLWGIYKNDLTLINKTKGWVKECLMMATYADGMYGENVRNNRDFQLEPTPAYGTMVYSIIVYEAFFIFASLLNENYNDVELYQFSTSYGIFESVGGNKNLKLLMDCLEENCRTTVTRYYGDTLDPATILNTHTEKTFRFTPEMAFGLANDYYNDPKYKAIYEQTASGVIPYADGDDYLDWVSGSAWYGNLHALPAIPMMYYGISKSLIKGIKSMLLV